MSIYTRRGDEGDTSLANGERVPKWSRRVEAYGTVDELNSFVGAVRASTLDPLTDEILHFVQQRLFNCSSSLATPANSRTARTPVVTGDDVALLERAIDRFETLTGPLQHFVLEGGCESACRLHVARAVSRRAERRIVALASEEDVDKMVLAFINRVSDTLFAAARFENATQGSGDELWDPDAQRPAL